MAYDDKKAVLKKNIQKQKQQNNQQYEEELTVVKPEETTPIKETKEVVQPTSNTPEQPTSTPTENKPDYTMDDVVSVAETGSLPPAEPKSAYDMYMEEAKNIYNQGVETNNKNAANQAASAGAQYREVIRNIGELNKANGRADTGYAGDTSIDAYNAYRNSANKSYSDANSTNNELYSYYLGEMTKLQEAKDQKEMTERQYQDQKETKVLLEVSNILEETGAKYSDGSISNDSAKRTWDYVTKIFGENPPESVMAYLENQKGFSEWLDAYNDVSDENIYESNHRDTVYSPEVRIDTKDTDNGNISATEEGDDFTVVYDGIKYQMETRTPTISDSEYEIINSRLSQHHGALLYFNGKLFVRTNNGSIKQAIGTNQDAGDGARKLIGAIENKAK